MNGFFGFSGGNAFIQKAIRFFTDSKWSHSFIVVKGPCKVMSVMETSSTIVKVTPLERKMEETDYLEFWEPIAATPETILAAGASTFSSYAGENYGYISYLWFLWRWLVRKLGSDATTMWTWATNGITCTELTCHYLYLLGGRYAELFKDKDLNTFSPQDLYVLVLENEGTLFRKISNTDL